MKSKSGLILSLCILLVACTGSPVIDEYAMTKSPWSYQKIQDGPIRAGKIAQRFELRSGDCRDDGTTVQSAMNDPTLRVGDSDCNTDRERSEVALIASQPGQHLWFAFSLYIPDDFIESNWVYTNIGQIHNMNGPTAIQSWGLHRPPVVQLYAKSGEIGIHTYTMRGKNKANADSTEDRYFVDTISSFKGKWHDVIFHFDSTKLPTKLDAFVDGRVVFTDKVISDFQADKYFPKYGIYRPFTKKHTAMTFAPMPTAVVYFDEIRLGTSRSDVDPVLNKNLTPVD